MEQQKDKFFKIAITVLSLIIMTIIIIIGVLFYNLAHKEIKIQRDEDGIYAVNLVEVKNANTVVVKKAYSNGPINNITVKLIGIKGIDGVDNEQVIAAIKEATANYDIMTLSTNSNTTKNKTISGYLWLTADKKNVKEKYNDLYNLNYRLLQNGIVAFNETSKTKYAETFKSIGKIAEINQVGFYHVDKNDKNYEDPAFHTITDEEIEAIKNVPQPDGVDMNNLKGTDPVENTEADTKTTQTE